MGSQVYDHNFYEWGDLFYVPSYSLERLCRASSQIALKAVWPNRRDDFFTRLSQIEATALDTVVREPGISRARLYERLLPLAGRVDNKRAVEAVHDAVTRLCFTFSYLEQEGSGSALPDYSESDLG
jgi:hypothetical protein